MAEMLAGEVERAVRLVEQRILAVRARMVARGETEVVGRIRPGDNHRLFKLPASAGMQSFDCGAALLELLAQGSFCQLVGVGAEGIGTEQDPFWREEAIAWIPHHCGRPYTFRADADEIGRAHV